MSRHCRHAVAICRELGLLAVASLLGACNPTFAVGGAVTGLAGTGLVLQNNAGDDLAVTGNGSFAFATPARDKGAYAVTVKAQPTSPGQICEVINATGQVSGRDVTDVVVACETPSSVGGVVLGLLGSGLVLQNNAGDDLSVGSDGAFKFPAGIASGGGYLVTV